MASCSSGTSGGGMGVNLRPPQTLLSLSKERIVEVALQAMSRIRGGICLASLGPLGGHWPFTCIPNFEPKSFRRQSVRQVQNFLTGAPIHLFNEIVLEMYRRDPEACVEVMIHPSLKTLEVNSKSLPMVLEYAYNLTNVTVLYLFFDINRHISLVPQFHAFVGSLTNLTHLKLSNCCTDQLLAVIGANCVNLEVLDAEEDSEMMTTDHGLAFLANCRNLRTVILNDAGDEYDYEDRYFGITGKGVANLLIALPKLSLLMCEPYLLREAIKFVHTVNVNGLMYKLTYLHTRFPDRDFLYCATSLCPDIQELVIEDQGRDCAEALTRMTSLESLSLENYSWSIGDERHYQTTFSRLTRLALKNPKMVGIDVDFMDKLGRWCHNLKSLSLTLYHRDLFTRVHVFGGQQTKSGVKQFLPNLESLTIDGDVSLCLIESLLTSVAKLKALTIYIHRQLTNFNFAAAAAAAADDDDDQPDDPPSGGFDAMMLRMARDGHLKDLTSLQCFQWDVSLETMLFIVDSCPQLRDIWGLDLLMLSPASISAIQSHIRRNNRWIDFHDGMCYGSSTSYHILQKGIPFLSERSKHRVEAADTNSCDGEGGVGSLGAGAMGGLGWSSSGRANSRRQLEKLLGADIEDIIRTLQPR